MNLPAATLILISFVLPVAAFAMYGFWRSPKRSKSEAASFYEDFLLSGRESSGSDIGSSTVAYMLQISTTFYFVYWGYNYGFATVFYLLSWALGIWLFARFSAELLAVRERFETLGGFLATANRVLVRRVIGLLVCAFFIGLFYVELYFSADFLTKLFSTSTEAMTNIWWVFFVALTVATVNYSVLGGMRKVIATDKIQLSLAYVGFAGVFCFLIPKAMTQHLKTGFVTFIITVVIYVVLLLLLPRSRSTTFIRAALGISLVAIVLTGLLRTDWGGKWEGGLQIAGIDSQLAEPWGWVTLFGFTVTNLLFQFCDGSNYQRIASLNLEDRFTTHEKRKRIEEVLMGLIIVSPLTWGFGILLGILLKASGVVKTAAGDEYIGFLQALSSGMASGDTFAVGAAVCMAVSMSCIMMSTADSAFLAYLQSAVRDVRQKPVGGTQSTYWFSIVALVLILGAALLQKVLKQDNILVFTSAVNSLILCLVVPAILSLQGYHLSSGAIIAPISIGGILVILSTFNQNWVSVPTNVQLVLPMFAALLGSLLALCGCNKAATGTSGKEDT